MRVCRFVIYFGVWGSWVGLEPVVREEVVCVIWQGVTFLVVLQCGKSSLCVVGVVVCQGELCVESLCGC